MVTEFRGTSDGRTAPGDRTAGYQSWQRLTFMHWRVPVDEMQNLLPAPLTVDSFDGSAWIGLVPFSMERIRPWWSPAVPGVSWFLETNVRTYVRHPDGQTGVWFFSLEANSALAVWIARQFWNLPYYRAALTLDRVVAESVEQTDYTGVRRNSEGTRYRLSVRVPKGEVQKEAPTGTLEHFLVERYLLFARDRKGRLFTGRVHHVPYRICTAEVEIAENSLVDACGCRLADPRRPDHIAYSDGVDVRVSPLTHLSEAGTPGRGGPN